MQKNKKYKYYQNYNAKYKYKLVNMFHNKNCLGICKLYNQCVYFNI